MKSILMGGAKTREAYPAAVCDALAARFGLDADKVYTRADVTAPIDADYIFATWGMPAFTEEEIPVLFPKLRAIFYAAGTVQGFAAPFLACGVRVFSAWAANAVPVAEFTASQILLANKGFFAAARGMKDGGWKAAKAAMAGHPGNFRTKVGILGAGRIGSLVIGRLAASDLEILVWDPFLTDERAEQLGVRRASLEEIFSECTTVSNHLANKPETVGILHYGLFSKMPPCSTFINTGRGAQVREEDLVRALTEDPTRTALLDVTKPEPPAAGHPFYTLDNVILTPHMAGSLGGEIRRMGEWMLDAAEVVTAGGTPDCEVTPAMLASMA